MNDKQYVLTDGVKYIKINEHDDPVKTGSIALAHVFENMLVANNYLQTPNMIKLNKDNGKNKFNLEELEGVPTFIRTQEDKKIEDDIFKEIQALDGTYKDFEDVKLSDNDNKHVYSGRTIMEDENFDFAEFMKTAIKVFSQIDTYIENMAYLEREMDLNLCDTRHYKRDPNTKMNAIEAQKLQYYEQELERERIKYKRNKIIASIINTDLDRLKKSAYVKVIERVVGSEYRYRRNNRADIEAIIRGKKANLKAV
jgi:hypothetical protein